MMTQEELILDYLRKGNNLTSLEALDMFGCFRLASRISDLKQRGYNIDVTMIRNNGKHYASYKLLPKKDLFCLDKEG